MRPYEETQGEPGKRTEARGARQSHEKILVGQARKSYERIFPAQVNTEEPGARRSLPVSGVGLGAWVGWGGVSVAMLARG